MNIKEGLKLLTWCD